MGMDDSNLLTFATKRSPDRTTAWPDEARELAFELYYTEAGRKLTTLQKLIEAEPYSLPIPYRTLYEWHRQHQWDIEADKRMVQFAPHRRRRTADLLVVAAEGFASYLAQVASGAVEPDKTKVAAAKVAMDAAGFASVRVDAPALPASTNHDNEPLDTSPAAAAERIRQRRAGYQGG